MKKNLSRKRRALRSLLFLVFVVLVMHLCQLWNFTPAAAMRDREREVGIGRTETITSATLPSHIREGEVRMVLSGAGRELMVSELYFHPLVGWRCDSSWQMEREEEKAVQLGGNASGNADGTTAFLYGWVADRAVTELELRLQCRRWYGAGEDIDVSLTVTDFVRYGGEQVFLVVTDAIPAHYTLGKVWLVTDSGEEEIFSW